MAARASQMAALLLLMPHSASAAASSCDIGLPLSLRASCTASYGFPAMANIDGTVATFPAELRFAAVGTTPDGSSDIDLVVTLPPVHTTRDMPEAPGTLEGRNAIPKDTWQASLARCLLNQEWVIGESVRNVDTALVPIVSFATRFLVSGGMPLRLDV